MTSDIWMAIAILICVALSAFFSASETAFTSASRVKLKTMMQNGNKRAKLAYELAEDYDRLLSTILVGNNIVNIAGSSLATSLFLSLLKDSPSLVTPVSTAVMTIIILIFGEVSPKTVAKESPEKLAMLFAPILKFLRTLVTPVNLFFVGLKKLLGRIFKAEETESFIEEEIMTMLEEAQNEGDIDAHEGELIRSVIEFSDDRDVSAILTPRVDITALEDVSTIEAAAALFRQTGYSRVPVYHDNLDHIVGILNEKDFYQYKHDGCTDITKIMRPAVFAPVTLRISALLQLFKKQKTHLIVVLDEFGGTEGIVTMEDVLEELVGEIYDEHDESEAPAVQTREDGSFLVEGSMQLKDLLDSLGIEDIYSSDTVGGWVSEVLGCVPFIGAAFETDEVSVRVTRMEKRRVMQVLVNKKETIAAQA